jgi:UDP-N-acetylglucosamine 2-epimerase (non-hydrolysing)
MKILHVAGARPNFMKLAPVLRALGRHPAVRSVLVHTEQHYDHAMSGTFFQELGLPTPDHALGVGSGTHAAQTAGVMTAIEPVLQEEAPDLVVVVGDVNSTLAAALTATKLGIPVAHVEAGLRSDDRSMPEEVNRILTDQLSEILLTPSPDADERLLREGIDAERIHLVGNVMIDSLLEHRERARELEMPPRLGVDPGRYVLATLHRPSNVDHADRLAEILAALDEIARERPVLLPLHPRTARSMERFGLRVRHVGLHPPLGYLEMIGLMESAAVVLTDSGGVQEETTALAVPCLTLRSSTERPITITEGTNRLVADRSRRGILEAYRQAVDTPCPRRCPALWDGFAGDRIARVLTAWGAPRVAEAVEFFPVTVPDSGAPEEGPAASTARRWIRAGQGR